MSRTIRRKNFELHRNSSWHRAGTRQFGPYAEYDMVRCDNGYYRQVFREPTERELYKAKRFAHGESSTRYAYSPSKYHRGAREAQYRMKTKSEIHRFFRNEELEPVISDKPVNCWWDWS